MRRKKKKSKKMDKKIFVENIKPIEIIWGQSTPEKLDVYYNLLKFLPNETFAAACKKILTTRQYSTPPLPADFIEAAKNFKPASKYQYDKNCEICAGSGKPDPVKYPSKIGVNCICGRWL